MQAVATDPPEWVAGHAPASVPGTSTPLSSAARDVVSAVARLRVAGEAFLGQHVQERPYLMLGAAMGVGFVFGGGASRKRGRFLIAMLGRIVVRRALDALLAPDASRSEV